MMERVLSRVLLGIAGIMALVMLFSTSAPQVSAWAENDFDYRIPIDITGARPDNYEIRIYIDKQDNLDDGCNDNWTDFRFYDNAEGDRLYHWIENSLEGDYAIAWVQVLDQDDNELYLYYGGNTGAENTENAENVFGYDVGFDTKTGWNETDPNSHIAFSIDNGIGTRLDLCGIYDDEAAYVYTLLNTGLTTFTMEWIWHMDNFHGTDGGYSFTGVGDAEGIFNNASGGEAALDDGAWLKRGIYGATGTDGAASLVNSSTYSVVSSVNDTAFYTTHYATLAVTADDVIYRTWEDDENRTVGHSLDNNTNPNNPTDTDNLKYVYPITSDDYLGSGDRWKYGWIDTVIYRAYVATEPTVSFGIVETPIGIIISTPTVDNVLIDRENTIDGSTAVTATQIKVQILIHDGDNADALTDNVHLWVKDNDGNVVIDDAGPIENTVIDENTLEYTFAAYDPANAMADASLGGFSVLITAKDNSTNVDNWGYGIVFTVDDMDDVALTQENLAGHRHKISGTGATISGGSVTLTVGNRVDNNDGTVAAYVTGDTFENTYAPSDNGTVYFELETAELDGVSASLVYNFPNIVPGFVSMIVDNSLIDNHRSDNAITATLITAIFEDNDNYDDFMTFFLSVRAADDEMIENNATIASVTYENENRVIVTFLYDAEDNAGLDAANMGAWDVHSYVTDNWGAYDAWTASVFTVDEMITPVGFTPTNPYSGWDLTVAGTSTRVSGTAAAVDNHRIVDALHGTFWQAAGNAYSENYNIPNASPGIPVSVTVTAWNLVLDGENTQSYTPHENQQYEISIRFEENYELVDWIPDASRQITIGFVEGIAPIVLSSNPENIIISTGENLAENIYVSDNGKYIRRRVLDFSGGRVIMIIVGDNTGTIGGTATGDVDDFFFFLQDLTGLYEPPDGIMSFRAWIGENLAIIHEDYWAADWKMVAWLVTGTRYQVWMRADDAPLRLIGPIDAVNSIEEKTIQVKPFVSSVIEIFDDVYWAAYRVSDNVLRIEYQDNLAETTFAYVTINNYRGTLIQAYQPDNSWFIITYSLASPDEGYSIGFQFTHETYGQNTISVPIATTTPEVGGITNRFNLPDGVTLASLGVFVVTMIIALAFDSTRVPFGMLAMAIFPVFCWRMGWLILPGPFNGAFTATMFIVAAVLVILAWRRK